MCMHMSPMKLGAMDLYQLFGFAEILKDSIKLFLKNAKLMALPTTLSLLSYSIFVSFFDSTPISFTCDMLAKESFFPIASSVTTDFITKRPRIAENVPYLLTIFFAFFLSYFIISFLSMVAAITISADSYSDNKLSLRELCSRIVRCWTRPFLTAFYTTILGLGYAYSVFYMATPLPVFKDLSNLRAAVLFCVAAYVFYLYLSSVWILSLVVAVVEEDGGGGIAALAKSAEIIRGQKINGFLINVVINLICLGVYLGVGMRGGKHDMIYGVLLVSFSGFMRILTFVAYTLLYFRLMESRE